MQFRLRTLMILVAIGPPLLAAGWWAVKTFLDVAPFVIFIGLASAYPLVLRNLKRNPPPELNPMFRFTIRDLLWLMVVVAVALAIYFAKPRRTQWEYKTKSIQTFNKFDLSAEGNEGWELMQVDDKSDSVLTLYFKRPK